MVPRGSDILRAIEIAAKYGLTEEKVDEDLVAALTQAAGSVLAKHPDGERLGAEIVALWKPILAQKIRG